MAIGYFDTTSSGFTLRIFYEDNLGILTITDMKLQSMTYSGTWYPGGTITVNGETVLQMNYYQPATHSFYFYGVGDSFVDMGVGSGATLPVSSSKITSSKAEIVVDITLYRNGSSPMPTLQNTFTVTVLSGFCYIDTGSGLETYQCYIDNGTSWDQCIPYIDNGTSWDMCS